MSHILLPAFLVLTAAVSAQPVVQTPALEPQTVTVSGEGVVSAPPDRAVVRLGVVTEAPTAAEALRQHEEDVARVLTRVRQFGIPDRQIEIDALQLGENYRDRGPEGYRAYRIVSVTTDSLRIVPELVASVVEEGANRLDGVAYTLRSAAEYRNRALDEAMTQARAKAERMATAAGAELGEVISIQERTVTPYNPSAIYPTSADAVRVEAQPGAYSTGSSHVQAGVVVRYRLVVR